MARIVWICAVILAAILASGAAGWYWMTGPMYKPGDLRNGRYAADPRVPQAGAPDRWTVAPGIELYHFEEGQGTPVLIVHGGPGFPPERAWRGGTIVARKYRTVYYHQRGCGRSTRPLANLGGGTYDRMKAVQERLGLPAQIADIERIREILGQPKLVLLGHSYGADIAALYAAEYPEHVRAAIYVAPADLVAMPPDDRANLLVLVRDRLPADMRAEYADYQREYFDFRKAVGRTEPESSEFYGRMAKFYRAALGEHVRSGPPVSGYEPLALYLSMGAHHDYGPALRRVASPALVIHGSRDLQPESVSRHFASYFGNSRFVAIPDAGHFVFEDQPERFAKAIAEFLDALPSE